MQADALLTTLPLEATLFLAGATAIFAVALLACLAVLHCCGLEQGRLPSLLEGAAVLLTCLAAAAACGLTTALFIALAAGVAWWRLPEPADCAASMHAAPDCICACACGARAGREPLAASPCAGKAAQGSKHELPAAEDAV